MYKLCIFAGTTEGRELVEMLPNDKISIMVCVATEYGESLLPNVEGLEISAKRLTSDEMTELFELKRFDMVIDATHPYAEIVTQNIKESCTRTGTEYRRLIRDSESIDGAMLVRDIAEAVSCINSIQGNVLLTTGSKELEKFTDIEGFTDRVYARVLPMVESVGMCEKAGLKPSHIIAMQGPFTKQMNVATMKSIGASVMVTKESGASGGFYEKTQAAEEAGAKLIVIGRPKDNEGLSFPDIIKLLESRFDISIRRDVAIVGIGPGSRSCMTGEALDCIRNAECLIGAKRMLEAVATQGQVQYDAILPGDIADFIASHGNFRRFAVVMSGDTGFYSGTKKLLPLLDKCNVNVIPGISSLSYLCAKAGTSYENVHLTSLHGRETDIAAKVRKHGRVFTLVGGDDGIKKLCRMLCESGLEDAWLTVGERMSYPDERIISGTAAELSDIDFKPLSAALIEHETQKTPVTQGLPDTAFQRGSSEKGVVPMTKSEVRAVCLSKLRLMPDSVCWDIGAGTGSVAIEMALAASCGHVYAIEKNEEAVELIRENIRRFGITNISVVHGNAPEALAKLPAPTHAFIGGTYGGMRDIIELLKAKNNFVRITATAIAVETVAELSRCLKEFGFNDKEVVQLSVARGRSVGAYTLMTAQNPIYIFTMQEA